MEWFRDRDVTVVSEFDAIARAELLCQVTRIHKPDVEQFQVDAAVIVGLMIASDRGSRGGIRRRGGFARAGIGGSRGNRALATTTASN
jgi:hypothetical protein